MKSELMLVIDQIGREKGIEKEKILAALEAALLTAAKKRLGQGDNIQVDIDTDTGDISIVSKKTITEIVVDTKTEISLEEARQIDDEAEMGDEIGSLIDMAGFGRIAAQAAKQVICQKVREAEWESLEREYSKKEGELVHGVTLRDPWSGSPAR